LAFSTVVPPVFLPPLVLGPRAGFCIEFSAKVLLAAEYNLRSLWNIYGQVPTLVKQLALPPLS
jgi:hypothetical protein